MALVCRHLSTPFGADDVDVERMQCPSELSHAIPAGGILLVDPEHVVLVGIERNRLTVLLQIGPRRGGIE